MENDKLFFCKVGHISHEVKIVCVFTLCVQCVKSIPFALVCSMWAPMYASTQRTPTSKTGATPTSPQQLAADKDRRQIEEMLKSRGSPCLLDCMELLLEDVDVFSARKLPFGPTASIQDGFLYRMEKDVRDWPVLDACLYIVTI